jgi:3-methyladenine DNA glycosylase AlkD
LGNHLNRKISAETAGNQDLPSENDKIKKDHELAQQLWKSGNHDARYLATMVAIPAKMDEALLDSWVQDLDNYVIADAFGGFANQTSFAQEKAIEWIKSSQEFVARTGWHLLAHLAMKMDDLPDAFFDPYLKIIEREIHLKPNRTREGMNNALIAIGIRKPALMEKALTTAEVIGEVDVDHGQTNCKTPFAPDYIERTVKRKKSKGQW